MRARQAYRVAAMGPRIARVTTTRNPVIGFLRNNAIRFVPQRMLIKAMAESDPHRTTAATS
jgi:hypothetical protein